jgi:hypothetical protein
LAIQNTRILENTHSRVLEFISKTPNHFPALSRLSSILTVRNLSKLCKAWKALERATMLERSHVIFWLGIAGFAFQLFPALSRAIMHYKDFSPLECWKAAGKL